jgi:outer membrane lipoprotein-sorting protein
MGFCARWLLLAALVLLAVVSPGCGGQKQTVDAKAVLSDAVAPMKALTSFHFTYEVVKPANAKTVEGTEVVKIVGDVTFDGRMKATIDVETRGVPLELAFIADGDTHYVQDPTSQKWISTPAERSPVGKVNLNAGAIQILEQIARPTYDGEDKAGGVACHRVKGTVAASAVTAIAGVVTTSEDFAARLWVGIDDHLVRRIELVGASSPDEDVKTTRVITLSEFNKPLSIEPPK